MFNQEKSQQVNYLFEKALSTLESLELSNKTSLFLVYAHHNPAYGKADADTSKYLIEKLSQIRVNLYSDQTPMGQAHSRISEALKEDGKLEDILTSQLCLLPTRLRADVEPVHKVVVCCSEVLEKYLEWPYYESFYQQLREAYRKDSEQRSTSAIREVVRIFSQEPTYKAGFHHVLTEMAFLQIRAEHQEDQHGIIPISLTPKSAKQCLGHFIPQTTVRMEDIPRFEEQAQAGREVYPNQSRHLVLFKLIERLLVNSSDQAKTFLNKFWQGYSACISQLERASSPLGWSEFTELVDSIFKDIQMEQHRDQTWHLSQTRMLHTEIVQKLLPPTRSLIDLREALYQHYQYSNLSIQRVSGQTASLDDCYINLAIVESHAQREKDKEELEKQAATFERLPSSERLEATNTNKLIALEKLFEKQKLRDGSEGVPKRILIQGRAGIGKTTLCKKLVYEYHQNGLWKEQFESVLWIPLRQLKAASSSHLEELLCQRYFANQGSTKAQALSHLFLKHQDKTLFILDGLDEVTEMFSENHHLHHFLANLLNQSHVLITSRPAGVSASQCNQLDLGLETIGFSAQNVKTYIETFVPESNQAAIGQFIERTPLIQSLVNIPIQLDALCYSWDKLPQNQAVTMSMLYEAMVDKLWRKDSVRLEKEEGGKVLKDDVIESLSEADLEELMTAEIDYLGYLAFKGLEAEKIEFSREELSQRRKELNVRFQREEKLPLSFTTNLKKTSYLHTADGHRPESERQYHFLHLTFQEFFAAKFLVWHLQTDIKTSREWAYTKISPMGLSAHPSQEDLQAFIAEHKYNPRYEIVWWMVAGLLKGTSLEHFFALLEQSPRDLIGMRHQQVVMRCLNEARNHLSPKTVLGLEKELMKWFDFEMKLNGWSRLGRQSAFPEHLLLTILCQSDERMREIIKTLRASPALSEVTVQTLIGACQHENKYVRHAAVGVLGGRSRLSEAALQALIGAFQDQDKDVRSAAVRALEKQSTLSEAAVQVLIGACQHQDKNVRSAAAHALGGRSTLSEAAVQVLIGSCQDQDKGVRSAAVRALGKQNKLSEASVQLLIGACQDQDENVRFAATHALRGRSRLPEAAVQVLIGACQDQNKGVRSAAVSALGGQSTLSEATMQVLIGACQDQDKGVRSTAARALGKQSPLSEATVQALIGACQDEDWHVMDAAANALRGRSVLSEAAVQVLIGACQHQDNDVRAAAVRALEGQSTLSEAAVQSLISICQHQDKNVRSAAVSALRDRSTLSEAAVQSLIGICQHQDKNVRCAAARALGGRSTLSEAAVQVLIGACQHQDKNIRSAAAYALEGRSTLSEAAVQALIGASQDEDWRVRDAAVSALRGRSILSEAAVQALIGACQNKGWHIRSAAARALGGQSALSEATVQVLIGACQDQDEDVRSAAVHALGKQSMLSEAAMQVLIGACQDQDEDVRFAAVSALGKQSMLSEATVQVLIGACQDQDENVRFAAVSALGKQSTLSEAAAQALIGACQDEDWHVRDAAVNALRGRGTLSEAAVQSLIGACQDENWHIRSAAVLALGGHSALSEAAVQVLIGACQHQNEDVRFAAVRALGGQSMLSEAAVRALIGACQHQNEDVRYGAVIALDRQSMLSEGAAQALILACQDQDDYVKYATARALETQLDYIYPMLPSLSPSQIEIFYTGFLFKYSCEHISPLYVQDHQLHFYTKSGRGQTNRIDVEKIEKIIEVFKNVQIEVGINSLAKEKLLLLEG